jgi:hypothetical protein
MTPWTLFTLIMGPIIILLAYEAFVAWEQDKT